MPSVSEEGMDEGGLPLWPAAERNQKPIGDALVSLLEGRCGTLLELSAATGQHAVAFSARLSGFDYWVSDVDPTHLATLERRLALAQQPRLRGPLRVDVTERKWPLQTADVIYNANMVHIAPWQASEGLFAGAGRLLPPGGLLITYGPYKIDGQHTSESNEGFDASLRARDPSWGVRDLKDLEQLAQRNGLELAERLSMPANNFLLVWAR